MSWGQAETGEPHALAVADPFDRQGITWCLAKQAYYREGRRIRAEFTVLEQHIGVAARQGLDAAERFFVSVGIGAYRIDLHPSRRGRNDDRCRQALH